MPFHIAWNALQTHVVAGTNIPNWTANSRLLGDSFLVAGVARAYIEVDSPGAQSRQRVPVADFQRVYDVWDSYCHGHTPRAALRDATRFSKYIISVLHWLKGQLGGQLP
jgi:hypothetical protein